jgi:hypothetical protein
MNRRVPNFLKGANLRKFYYIVALSLIVEELFIQFINRYRGFFQNFKSTLMHNNQNRQD